MNDRSICDVVRISAMAMADGESPEMTPETIEAHLAECPECRAELESLVATAEVFAAYRRRAHRVEIWGAIEPRLVGPTVSTARARDLRLPMILAVLLACYKLVEQLAERPPVAGIVLLPLAVAVLLFVLLKQNPFTIATGTFSEGV
jgi:anti-sigma factor RsiW